MRTKFGMKGDEEEDEDELEKKELEEHERRAKHSIEGILGDRCECVHARVSSFTVACSCSWHCSGEGGGGVEFISPRISGPQSELVYTPLTKVCV